MRPDLPQKLTPEQFVEQMLPLLELEKSAEIEQVPTCCPQNGGAKTSAL